MYIEGVGAGRRQDKNLISQHLTTSTQEANLKMGNEKTKKRAKTVKVGGRSSTSAKEGGAFNPAIEEIQTDSTSKKTESGSEEGVMYSARLYVLGCSPPSSFHVMQLL